MLSKKSVRWAILVPFLVLLLATPRPALAGADCGAVYQNGGNCCDYTGGSNCYDYTGGSNCYGYQDSSNCYNYTDGSNCYGYQDSANCSVNQYGGNGYAPYGAPTGGTYVVQWGDTMRIIADRLGIPLNSLIAANPQIWNPSLIYAGQVLCLPSNNAQPTYYEAGQNWEPPAGYQWGSNSGYREHQWSSTTLYTIQPGDTLKAVARKYGTTVDALLDLNPSLLGVPGRIHVGLVIRIY